MGIAGVPGDDLLTKKQVADLLQVSESTIERLTASGEGPPSIKIGRSRQWFHRDVLAWLEARREPPSGAPT